MADATMESNEAKTRTGSCWNCGASDTKVIYMPALGSWTCGNCIIDRLEADDIVVGVETPDCDSCGEEASSHLCDECSYISCDRCGDHAAESFCYSCLQEYVDEESSEREIDCEICGDPVETFYCSDHLDEWVNDVACEREVECERCSELAEWVLCSDDLDHVIAERTGSTKSGPGRNYAVCGEAGCNERSVVTLCSEHCYMYASDARIPILPTHPVAAQEVREKARVNEDGTEITVGDVTVRWEG